MERFIDMVELRMAAVDIRKQRNEFFGIAAGFSILRGGIKIRRKHGLECTKVNIEPEMLRVVFLNKLYIIIHGLRF